MGPTTTAGIPMTIDWKTYDPGSFYDEIISSPGNARMPARRLVSYLGSLGDDDVQARRASADVAIKQMGVTFTVYSEEGNIDRSWPFDIIPRTVSRRQWEKTAAGLEQRLRALNLFIDDLYHDQKIVKDGVFPRYILDESKNYRKECEGVNPRFGVWAHICGTDLVRDKDGQFYVLEDNLRVPSGVSYMLENRSIMKRVIPEVFEKVNIAPVGDYPEHLFDMLSSLSPRRVARPVVVVLTPVIYNSAYFVHSFLAQRMGAELVEGSDLVVVEDDCVYLKSIAGLE